MSSLDHCSQTWIVLYVVMFRPGLAQKPRLWLGFWGLRLCETLGRAKAATGGLALAWLGPSRGFWHTTVFRAVGGQGGIVGGALRHYWHGVSLNGMRNEEVRLWGSESGGMSIRLPTHLAIAALMPIGIALRIREVISGWLR